MTFLRRAMGQEMMFDNYVVLQSSGYVLNVPYVRIRTTCKKIRGSQRRRECELRFGSWSMDGSLVNITTDEKLEDSDATFTGLKDSGWTFEGGKVKYGVSS